MSVKQRNPTQREWSQHDAALWHTCEIAVDLVAGNRPRPAMEVLTPFPLRLGPDERVWASGEFQVADFRAVGDGSYVHNSGFFLGRGIVGLAGSVAFLAGQAAVNKSRRDAAAEAAAPRWVVVDQGLVYLTAYGCYLASGGLGTWPYRAISGGEMVGPREFNFYGQTPQGPVNLILVSDWAELAFITWALAVHPRHPQLLGGGWLPPDWLAWCASQGYRTRLPAPALTR